MKSKLSFCDDRLCELRAFVTFTVDTTGERQFLDLRKSLVDQYGQPDETEARIPQSCSGEFMQCILDDRAKWNAQWKWPDGSVIQAQMDVKKDSPVLSIFYRHGRPRTSGAPAEGEVNTNAF